CCTELPVLLSPASSRFVFIESHQFVPYLHRVRSDMPKVSSQDRGVAGKAVVQGRIWAVLVHRDPTPGRRHDMAFSLGFTLKLLGELLHSRVRGLEALDHLAGFVDRDPTRLRDV